MPRRWKQWCAAKMAVQERNGEELNQVESFRYLGSVICESGGCEKDVQVRVSASWMKWKEVSAVMNDRRMLMRLTRRCTELWSDQ